MKAILSERNLVIVLFVMVFVSFSLAHEDSKKMEKASTGINSTAISQFGISEKPLKSPAGQTSFYRE